MQWKSYRGDGECYYSNYTIYVLCLSWLDRNTHYILWNVYDTRWLAEKRDCSSVTNSIHFMLTQLSIVCDRQTGTVITFCSLAFQKKKREQFSDAHCVYKSEEWMPTEFITYFVIRNGGLRLNSKCNINIHTIILIRSIVLRYSCFDIFSASMRTSWSNCSIKKVLNHHSIPYA